MTVSEDVKAKLETLQKKLAAQGQEVSMEELIRAHERGLSGKEAKVLDGMLAEAKARIKSELNIGKTSTLLDPNE